MGQANSKRDSKTSTSSLLISAPLNISSQPSSPSSPHFPPSAYSPDSSNSVSQFPANDITPPAPRQQLHRLSEIIDPLDVLRHADTSFETPTKTPNTTQHQFSGRGLVQSPSGNALSAHEFISHPDRPLTLWERQHGVIAATKEQFARYDMESRAGTRSGWRKDEKARLRKGKAPAGRRRCCGLCWW